MDHVLDFCRNERSALQKARNYCARGSDRKGPLPGEFLGVVVTKYESDPKKWKPVKFAGMKLPPNTHFQLRLVKRFDGNQIVTHQPLGQPNEAPSRLSGRPRRVKGKTVWLYFVDAESKAFHVDDWTHAIKEAVV